MSYAGTTELATASSVNDKTNRRYSGLLEILPFISMHRISLILTWEGYFVRQGRGSGSWPFCRAALEVGTASTSQRKVLVENSDTIFDGITITIFQRDQAY